MPFDLSPFAEIDLDEARLRELASQHHASWRPRLERLWSYYRNPVRLPGAGATHGSVAHEAAQVVGLPDRLRRRRGDAPKPEIVIENDIGWRVDAMVDFVFGKPTRIESLAPDPAKRALIEAALDAAWEASGGVGLLQDFALLGGVYGYADLLVRPDDALSGEAADEAARRVAAVMRGDDQLAKRDAMRLAGSLVRFEPIEPTRGIPLVDPADYRNLLGYVVRTERDGAARTAARAAGHGSDADRRSAVGRWLGSRSRGHAPRLLPGAGDGEIVELFSASARQLYADGRRIVDQPNPLGVLPVVHVQNLSQPFQYAGLSDVEPLIPLQDELNTRLSDRAHRVTMQSFRMYVAKGMQGMGDYPVGPGQVWTTDNPDADVKAFGGDLYSPSEDEHITQIREAMDKASGVSPVVLGLLRAKIGHLSSENALRVTLMGVLAKAQRKRMTYGRGILRASKIALAALDLAGFLPTTEEERELRLRWPDPLPRDENRQVAAALSKVELGVPRERVLAELGYGDADDGVV